MTVIVPYKKEIFDGLELLYALRSIEKNLTGFTNVIIIGTPPAWYKGDSVNSNDFDGRKQYSIYQKVLVACSLNECSNYFVMWNDDHFLLKPLDVLDIKYWQNGLIKDEFKRQITARYSQAINNTIEFFPGGLNFDIHTPIVYNKEKFKMLFWNKENEILIKSYYCNSLKHEGEFMADCKINHVASKEAIEDLIKDKLFFSTGVNGVKTNLIKKLNELYPEKSKFEK